MFTSFLQRGEESCRGYPPCSRPGRSPSAPAPSSLSPHTSAASTAARPASGSWFSDSVSPLSHWLSKIVSEIETLRRHWHSTPPLLRLAWHASTTTIHSTHLTHTLLHFQHWHLTMSINIDVKLFSFKHSRALYNKLWRRISIVRLMYVLIKLIIQCWSYMCIIVQRLIGSKANYNRKMENIPQR